jgi:hypothetical protein
MGKIVWIVSYPKSGNTWLRLFLANLYSEIDQPVDINADSVTRNASDRELFDLYTGAEASDLTLDEIENCRPAVYNLLAANSQDTIYLKAHDAFTYTAAGEPMFPSAPSHGTIYIIRNPLDVVVSYAHHVNTSVAEMVSKMANPVLAIHNNPAHVKDQLRQRLLTWSDHVKSWIDQRHIPVHLVKYEDMLNSPINTFTAVIHFLNLSPDPTRIQKAIDFSGFDTLRKQEQEKGFKEKPAQADLFFRKGQVGSWREELTPEQAARIIADHGEVMQRFGYLTEDGQIVY